MLEQYSHSTGEILSQQHDWKAEFPSFEIHHDLSYHCGSDL